jgi:hypothetical protein
MLTVMLVSVSESPVFMVTLELSCIDRPKVPELDSDQNEMSVSTSPFVPAQLVHDGWLDAVTDPADAEFHDTDGRVVTEDTFDVPAAPGAGGRGAAHLGSHPDLGRDDKAVSHASPCSGCCGALASMTPSQNRMYSFVNSSAGISAIPAAICAEKNAASPAANAVQSY